MSASEAGTERLSPGFASSSGWSSRLPARPCLSCSDLWWSMASVCRSERTAPNVFTARHSLPPPEGPLAADHQNAHRTGRNTKATVWKPEDGEGPSPWNPRQELVPGPETGKNRREAAWPSGHREEAAVAPAEPARPRGRRLAAAGSTRVRPEGAWGPGALNTTRPLRKFKFRRNEVLVFQRLR